MWLSQLFDGLPNWLIYLLIVGLSLLAVEGGFRLGRYWRQHRAPSGDGGGGALGTMVGTTLALLTFIVVFMIGIQVDRVKDRRHLVTADAQAIETTMLRAGFLSEPQRSTARRLLNDYVDLRLTPVDNAAELAAVRARSEAIQAELWAGGEAAAAAQPASNSVTLYIEALNTLIDVHNERATIALSRVTASVWLAVFFVAFVAMAMVGFVNGMAGSRHPVVLGALVLVFSAVILLLIDLDRPQDGAIQVSYQPLIDLQRRIRSLP